MTRSQKDLAAAIGVTPQVISQWRTGRRNPHPANLRELADWFEDQANRLSESADALRLLAQQLEDPERRTAVTSAENRAETSAERVRKRDPPQLRQRSGCNWLLKKIRK